MREELDVLRRWQSQGATLALARVIATSSSAPRGPGATLALHPNGDVLGNVSGGCVEGAVVEVATEVLRTGTPQRVSYGIADEEAFAVGLTCGGTIDVLVQGVTANDLDFASLRELTAMETPVAIATVAAHEGRPELVGRTFSLTADRVVSGDVDELGQLGVAVVDEARAMLAVGATRLRSFGPNGERRREDVAVFVQTFAPRPRLIIFGATDFASALARQGRVLDFRVTVCDARARFATSMRFPDADEVVNDWPHRYLAGISDIDEQSALCVLTHEPKFDVPVLMQAFRSTAGYIGVMGSRRTHLDRMERLRAAGATVADLARLRSPVGLDLGARTPAETAVSIMAEVIADCHGGSGERLRNLSGEIHASRVPRRQAATHAG